MNNRGGFDLDLDLDLNIEDDFERLKEKVEIERKTLTILEGEVNYKKHELKELEEQFKYYGGFKKYLNQYLNKTYHTIILIGFMFLGYTISGFKNVGLKIWKSPTSIIFYAIFTIGFFLLTGMEYLREKDEKGGKEDVRGFN